MEEIRPLAETSFDDIFMAWEDSFRDYERTRTKEELRKMLSRRGFAPALSFGAFDEQQLVSFTLNAFGTHNGVNTAYDTGTGTIKSHRGKELSTKIFMESLPYLKQAGTRQYLLEVLQHNKAAVSIYTNIGFRVSREFNYFISNMENSSLKGSAMQARYRLIDIDLNSKVEMMCMWDWYTGVIIWKTQNPWTALVGQMYDVYLDPNACLYGLAEGSKPLHIMYDMVHKSVMVVNNDFKPTDKLRMSAKAYDFNGNEITLGGSYFTAPANKSKTLTHFSKTLDTWTKSAGAFLYLYFTRDKLVDCFYQRIGTSS